MNRKNVYWGCGILMVLSLMYVLCAGIWAPQAVGGTISLWTLLRVFAAGPIFYYCLGFVCALRFLPVPKKDWARTLCLVLGAVLTALLVLISLAELLGHPVSALPLVLLRQMFRVPGWMLLPSILLAEGIAHRLG